MKGINFVPTIPFNKEQGEVVESNFPSTEFFYVVDDNNGINDIEISTSLSLDKEEETSTTDKGNFYWTYNNNSA